MQRLAVPLGLIGMFLWYTFADAWWASGSVIVLLALLGAWQEKRIEALQSALDTLQGTGQLQDHEPQSETEQQAIPEPLQLESRNAPHW